MGSRRVNVLFVEGVRFLVVLFCTACGYKMGVSRPFWMPVQWHSWQDPDTGVFVFSVLGAAAGYVGGGIAGRLLHYGFGMVEEQAERVSVAQALPGVLGAAVGVVAALLANMPVLILAPALWAVFSTCLTMWMGGTLGYRIACRKADELLGMMGLSMAFTPREDLPLAEEKESFLLDSAAVIDGRLLSIVRSGFLQENLLLSRFVLDEIQGIADSADPKKRRAGRRGLEILDALRQETLLVMLNDELPEVAEVDAKLVQLAKRLPAVLFTTDYNLQKVAELQGVRVQNVNRLAEALRPPYVAGDRVEIRIASEGREEAQGVGYVEDGTMVVVNGVERSVGQTVQAVVSSVHQTSVGRMLFARCIENDSPQVETHSSRDAETLSDGDRSIAKETSGVPDRSPSYFESL